jgi:hypothetical protein
MTKTFGKTSTTDEVPLDQPGDSARSRMSERGRGGGGGMPPQCDTDLEPAPETRDDHFAESSPSASLRRTFASSQLWGCKPSSASALDGIPSGY